MKILSKQVGCKKGFSFFRPSDPRSIFTLNLDIIHGDKYSYKDKWRFNTSFFFYDLTCSFRFKMMTCISQWQMFLSQIQADSIPIFVFPWWLGLKSVYCQKLNLWGLLFLSWLSTTLKVNFSCVPCVSLSSTSSPKTLV